MTMHHHTCRGIRANENGGTVERQIAALRGSISAGRGHRDHLLEQASESVGRQSCKLRSARVTIVLSVLLVLVSPVIGALTRVKPPAPPTAEQANSAALRHAKASRMSFDWALVDLFSQFREKKRPAR